MRAHANTRVRAALLQTLDRETAVLSQAWPDARRGAAEGSRRVRIATRRLRQALAIVGLVTAERRADLVARDLRTIGKTFGPVRDFAMTTAFLAEYEDRADVGAAALEMRIALESDRDAVFAVARRAAREVPIRRVTRRLAGVRRAVDAASSGLPWARALASVVTKRAADAESSRERSSSLYEPDRLHAIRISIKKLRYAVEIAAEAGLVRQTLAQRLSRHQKRLGAWHDRVTMLDVVRQRQALAPASALSSLRRLADQLDREAHVLHGKVRRGFRTLEKTMNDLRVSTAQVVLDLRPQPARARLSKRQQRPSRVRTSRQG